MALSPQDVHDKQFKLVRNATGYDMDEVDAFLDEVESEIARLHGDLDEARAAAATPGEAPRGDSPDAMHSDAAGQGVAAAARLLELAQRAADEHVAEAKRQADAVADEIQQRAREAVALLEAQRVDLEARVSRLRAFEADIRARLRGYLETQLRDLNASAPAPVDQADPE